MPITQSLYGKELTVHAIDIEQRKDIQRKKRQQHNNQKTMLISDKWCSNGEQQHKGLAAKNAIKGIQKI